MYFHYDFARNTTALPVLVHSWFIFGRSFLVLNRDTLSDVKIIHILFFLLNHGQRDITPVSSTSQMKRGKIHFDTHPSKLGNNYVQCHDFPFKQRFGKFLTADLQQYFLLNNRIESRLLYLT